MLTVCARWETIQLDNEIEWRMWRQLRGAFFPSPNLVEFIFTPISPKMRGIQLKQFETMEESLAHAELINPSASKVFLEPSGTKTIAEIPDGDLIYVLGNTASGNKHLADPADCYKIKTPGQTDLYGINAIAIALAVRYGQ